MGGGGRKPWPAVPPVTGGRSPGDPFEAAEVVEVLAEAESAGREVGSG